MSRELPVGGNSPLTREIPDLTKVAIGLRLETGADRSLADSTMLLTLLCGSDGKVSNQQRVVFHNQMTDDAMTAQQVDAALGPDSEQVVVDLNAVPGDITKIVFVAAVDPDSASSRNLGQFRECRIRALDARNNQQLVLSADLTSHLASTTAAVLGELYQHRGEWKFKVVAQGYSDGLTKLSDAFGFSW